MMYSLAFSTWMSNFHFKVNMSCVRTQLFSYDINIHLIPVQACVFFIPLIPLSLFLV